MKIIEDTEIEINLKFVIYDKKKFLNIGKIVLDDELIIKNKNCVIYKRKKYKFLVFENHCFYYIKWILQPFATIIVSKIALQKIPLFNDISIYKALVPRGLILFLIYIYILYFDRHSKI